eukprot:3367981-Prorocentrum_lima.AAC.1
MRGALGRLGISFAGCNLFWLDVLGTIAPGLPFSKRYGHVSQSLFPGASNCLPGDNRREDPGGRQRH